MVSASPFWAPTVPAFEWLTRVIATRYDDDPMHESTSPQRKSFKRPALAATVVGGLGAAGALVGGVTPAAAAGFAQTIDAQVAVFMAPLSLLVLAMLWEVARLVWRGTLPEQLPQRGEAGPLWAAEQS